VPRLCPNRAGAGRLPSSTNRVKLGAIRNQSKLATMPTRLHPLFVKLDNTNDDADTDKSRPVPSVYTWYVSTWAMLRISFSSLPLVGPLEH